MKTFTLLLKLLKVLGTLWDNLDWYLKHLRSSLNYLCFTRSRLIYWTEFYYQKLNLFNFLPWYGMRKKLHWEYPRQYKVDWWRHELDHMTFFEYNFAMCYTHWGCTDVICCLLLLRISGCPLFCSLLGNTFLHSYFRQK